MKRKFSLILLAYLTISVGADNKNSLIGQKKSKEIFELLNLLSERLMGESHYRRGYRLIDKTEGIEKAWLLASLAEYHRELARKPIEGIKLLAPLVLGKEGSIKWLEELRVAESKRRNDWLKAKNQAAKDKKEPPPAPTGLAKEFPSIKTLKFTEESAPAAFELARCLAIVGNLRSALSIVDQNGQKFQNDNFLLIQSYETLSDLRVIAREFKIAQSGYKTALKIFRNLDIDAEKYNMASSLDKWQIAVKKRITDKLNEVNRLLKIEQFGPEYVLFEEAEEERINRKNFLKAIKLHSSLIEKYPKTMMATSSRCMIIKCLLEQAKMSEPKRNENKYLIDLEKKLSAIKKIYSLARRYKAPEVERNFIKSKITNLEAKIEEVKDAPYSEEAMKQAVSLAELALKNEWTLHNGEILVDLANHYFRYDLDPDKADKYFRRAWNWLEKVSDADTAFKTFKLPVKAVSVATPQQELINEDFLGNITTQNISAGKVVNRKTSKWYLNDLKAKCVKSIGFICFVREQKEEAKTWLSKILLFCEKSKKHESKQEWNDYRRLTTANEKGYLYAHEEELKNFKGKLRFMILLTDFFYCTERFTESIEISNRVLESSSRLTKAQKAYLHFVKGSCLYWTKGRDEAFNEYEKSFTSRDTFYTSDRARFAAGNCIEGTKDESKWRRGQGYLQDLIKSRRINMWVQQAKLTYGPRLIERGKIKEGMNILKSVSKEFSEYESIAKWLIGKYESQNKKTGIKQ